MASVKSYFLITNEHVIDDCAYVIAYSDQYKAAYKLTDLIAVDKEKDIAILRFDENASVQPLKVDSTTRLLRGQPVTAIGSPQGVLNTVSSGNISNIVYYSDVIQDAIQFTAPISPGSSGGVLFNDQGYVIGLCVSMLTEGEAMYYAIPIKYVEELYITTRDAHNTTLIDYNGLDFPAPTVIPSTDGIQLSWKAIPGADKYIIYRRRIDGNGVFVRIKQLTSTSYLDMQPKMGNEYEYKVEAIIGSTTRTSGTTRAQMPNATATPKPTATPRASESTVTINSTAKANKGQYTISWVNGTAPYRITWKPTDGKGEIFSDSGVYSKSYTTPWMIPGCQYSVTVSDSKGKSVTKTVSVPSASTFRDGTLTAAKIGIQLSPRRDADGRIGSGGPIYIQSLNADDMVAGINKGAAYGLYYRIDLPSFSGKRTYMQTIVFRSPNGYRYIWYADNDEYTFPGYESWWKWDCMGMDFFQELYKTYRHIPTGQYYIDMYWNGMLVKSSPFRIQ